MGTLRQRVSTDRPACLNSLFLRSFTDCGVGTDKEGEECVSNFINGISITAGFTLFFTFLFIWLHFAAWSKYRRNKRLAMEKAGQSKGYDDGAPRKQIDPSIFYSNYGAPLQAYGELVKQLLLCSVCRTDFQRNSSPIGVLRQPLDCSETFVRRQT